MYPVHDLVAGALTELLHQGPLSQGKLELAWRAAVGNALSKVATVRLQEPGIAEVTVADQRWHRELERSAPMILDRLKALLGSSVVTRVMVMSNASGSRHRHA